ncbi:unnamed protein product [Auanema sp. JU1783]|nr:unnamed protein product [Auanema sp. JU1783]
MDDQLEDGEILDDDDHTTIVQPTTSESKESEIDRIIEETKAIDDKSSPNNKHHQIRHGSAFSAKLVMEDPDLRALRLAALGTLGKTVKDKSDKLSMLSSSSVVDFSHLVVGNKVSDKEDPRSRGRVSADMVLGEENKEVVSLRRSNSPSPNIEDNYDNVGMDIDSNCSEPDINSINGEEARNTLVVDAGRNNGIIYEGTEVRVKPHPRLSNGFSRDEYRIKYESLEKLDKRIRSRVDDIEEAHERRNKIMMELESISKSLEDFKNDYIQAIKDRDGLRKELSDYEEQKIKLLLFGENDLKPKEEPKVSIVPTPEENESEPIVPPKLAKLDTQNETVTINNMSSSSVNDEERLRKNLLEKLKSVQAAKEKERKSPPALEKNGILTNTRSPGSFESADEENSNNSSFASVRDSVEPSLTPKEVNYGNHSSVYPPRFLNHLGLNERNPLTITCPFEMTGRCKDYTCT